MSRFLRRPRSKYLLTTNAAGALLLLSSEALAADYYVGPQGVSASIHSTCEGPSDAQSALSVAQPGDNVIFCDGVYENPLVIDNSGTSDAPITLRAADNAVPVLRGTEGNASDGLSSNGSVEHIIIDGLWLENWEVGGIGLDYLACEEEDPSQAVANITIRHCVVDSNQTNGISAYLGSGYLIERNIASRNGWGEASWSSNINLYGVTGSENVVRENVAFHGIDTSDARSDGNGYIIDLTTDQGGALFEHNIGFLNGGACIAVTDAGGALVRNNSCYHNVQDASSTVQEFNFNDTCRGQVTCINVDMQSWSFQGYEFANNAAVATSGKSGVNAFDSCSNQMQTLESTGNDISDQEGVFADPGALDFTVSGSAGAQLAFDANCIHEAPGMVDWWTYAPDLEYIQSIGGIRNCFNPGETTCFGDSEICDGRCVDVTSDLENCGACGTVCEAGEACSDGACVGPSGEFTFDEDSGYVSVCEWGGFAWTHAGPEDPGVNDTVSEISEAGPLCYTGTVAAYDDYGGHAMVGININQAQDQSASAGDIAPEGAGIIIDIANNTDATLRLQLQDEDGGDDPDHRWCIEIQGSGGFYPWSAFNTQCWDGAGNPYAMEPIGVIAIMVAGRNVDDVEFDFCLESLAPSDTTCESMPGETGGTEDSGDAESGGEETGGEVSCQEPLQTCEDECVDLQSDPEHCGSCGTACEGEELCSLGECSSSCADGLEACGQACADLSSDILNCGGCGEACQTGQTCEDGACVGDPETNEDGGNGDGGDASSGGEGGDAAKAGCSCATDGSPSGSPLAALIPLGLLARLRSRRRRRSSLGPTRAVT